MRIATLLGASTETRGPIYSLIAQSALDHNDYPIAHVVCQKLTALGMYLTTDTIQY